MNSPIQWRGGKSRLAKTIVERFPEHRRYCEVFAGAGWVFFRKPQERLESLNDINSDLVTFYRVLQNHLEEFCRQFKWLLASREMFNDFRTQALGGGGADRHSASCKILLYPKAGVWREAERQLLRFQI